MLSSFLLMILVAVGETVVAGELRRRATSWTSPTEPQQTGTIANCNRWYNVVHGDSCASVEAAFGITSAEFLLWNPSVSADCSQNFWTGDAYCVGVSSSSSVPPTHASSTSGSPKTTTANSAPAGPTFTGMPCTCNAYYTTNAQDTCATVEARFGISAANFLAWNPAVSSDCSSNFWAGYAYCVGVSGSKTCPSTTGSITTRSSTTGSITAPSSSSLPPTTAGPTPASPTWPGIPCACDLYWELGAKDTCDSVQSRFSITADQFLAWNPMVSSNCTFNFYVGYSYCVGVSSESSSTASGNSTACSTTIWTPPSGLPTYSTVSSETSTSVASAPTSTQFPPQPLQPGTPSNCQTFYQAQARDTCDTIALQYSHLITLAQFLQWNPAVGPNCTSLYVNYYYCVTVPVTYTDLPPAASQLSYAPGATALPTTAWNVSQISATLTTFAGAATGCPILFPGLLNSTCDQFTSAFDLSLSNLEAWNTGINCTSLTYDTWYCIANPASTISSAAATPTSTPTNGGPQPQLSGTISDCSQYWFVAALDNCTSIAQANRVTEAQLEVWNPVLGSNCSGLQRSYYVCVGVPGNATAPSPSTTTSTTKGSSGAPTSTKSVTSSTVLSIPSPTQSGMVSGCVWFYLVEHQDGCYNIAQEAGISLSSLYSMNPALGGDCSGLDYGYYICLGTAGRPMTVTSGSPIAPTPSPVQSGMFSSCSRFYLVELGDGCANIATAAGIPLSTFYAWNPAVGTNCAGLIAGDFVCIGNSTFATTITRGAPLPAPTS